MHHSSLGPPAGRQPEGLQFRPLGVNLPRVRVVTRQGSPPAEAVKVVRQAISTQAVTRRRPDEHLAVLLPGVAAFINRTILRLPQRSRLRQGLIRRAVRLGIEAANRRDYRAAFALFDPAVELVVPPGLASMGLESSVQGHDARIRFEVKWRGEWGDFAYVPEELFDLEGQVLVVGRMRGSGPSSGAAFDIEWADLLTLDRGRVVREHVFLEHAEALEAVGLRPPVDGEGGSRGSLGA